MRLDRNRNSYARQRVAKGLNDSNLRFPRTQQVHACTFSKHERQTDVYCVPSSTKLFICRGRKRQCAENDTRGRSITVSIDSEPIWRKREDRIGNWLRRTIASAVNFRAGVRDKSIAKPTTCPGDPRDRVYGQLSIKITPRLVSLSRTWRIDPVVRWKSCRSKRNRTDISFRLMLLEFYALRDRLQIFFDLQLFRSFNFDLCNM